MLFRDNHKTIIVKGVRMIQKNIKDLDLGQIAQSGQCFRMFQVEDHTYTITALDRHLQIRQEGEDFTFSCQEQELEEIWSPYLDLHTDYGKIKKSIASEDEYLRNAAAYGWGIRILRQDTWEMIITFLISQNNNIPRIKKGIQSLCQRVGQKKESENGTVYHTFPTPEEILWAGADVLSQLGLGYRDKYIYRMAQSVCDGHLDLEELKAMGYDSAHKKLMEQYGVGKKVADCICLYGLHHIEAFPVDTHIKKILEVHYPEGFPHERYQGYAGILQQYMFYYDLQQEGKAEEKHTKTDTWEKKGCIA